MPEGDVAAGADAQPKASAPPSAESVGEGGGEHLQRQTGVSLLSADPERRMRFYLACAIVDLKFDIWEEIKTRYVLDPTDDLEVLDAAESDGEANSDAGARTTGSCHQPDVKFDGGEHNSIADADSQQDGMDSKEEEDEEEGGELWREFTEKFVKASGYDDRMKELDAINEVYFDTEMDEETRTFIIDRLWRHIEKELSDRARAVSTGKFKF